MIISVRRAIIGEKADYVSEIRHHWPMEDLNVSGTSIFDLAGFSGGGPQTLTAVGDVTSANGPASIAGSKARVFNATGADGYASNGASLRSWLTSHSISCWVRLTDNTVADASGFDQTYFVDEQVTDGTDYARINNLQATSGIPGAIRYTCCGSNASGIKTPADSVPSGVWTHWCITNDGGGESGTKRAYINGQEVATTATGVGEGTQLGVAGVRIGSRDPAAVPANGLIINGGRMGRLRVWRRALSPRDIAYLYYMGG